MKKHLVHFLVPSIMCTDFKGDYNTYQYHYTLFTTFLNIVPLLCRHKRQQALLQPPSVLPLLLPLLHTLAPGRCVRTLPLVLLLFRHHVPLIPCLWEADKLAFFIMKWSCDDAVLRLLRV